MNFIYLKNLFIFFAMGALFFIPSAHAGKQKSEKAYLEQIDATIVPIEQSLDRLKEILDSNNNVGSFLTTDFWGLKPSWYLSLDTEIMLTNQYVYADQIIDHYGVWNKFPEQANRHINGVIFSPVKSDNSVRKLKGNPLFVSISFQVDTSPGFDGPFENRFIDRIKQDFANAGIPQAKMDDALDYLDSKFSKCFFKIEQSYLTKFDALFSGNTKNGFRSDYDKIFREVDNYYAKHNQLPPQVTPEHISVPAQHPHLFTEENFADAGNPPVNVGSFREFYTSTRDKRDKKKLKKLKTLLEFYLNSGMLNISISADLQCFKIGNGESKSIKYNQINMLKQLLDEKIAAGRATKINKKGKFDIYQDTTGNPLYKGELGIDFDSGVGYWQMPIIGAKTDLEKIQKDVRNQIGKLDLFINEYYALCKKATITKFSSKSTTSTAGQKSDF